MGAFFIYILKSAVCLVLFYLFFKLLLSRETFHRFNRVALLGVLLLSLLIPCIEVTTRHQVEVQQAVLSIEQLLMMAEMENVVPAEVETGEWQQAPDSVSLSWIQIVLLVYLTGIVVLVCRNIYSLLCLIRLICSGKREKLERGITLVVHDQAIAPFSWMKYIVISRKDLEENGREILIHETAHIRNRHSIDLLIADVCIFFQWFNPGAWLLKQELQNIHEYEADETVINEGVNAKEYQLLLIKKAVGTRLYSMANSFNHSKLKKRITMMLKEKSNPWARLKYLYVLPLAAIAVTAFARPEISEKADEISAVKVNDLAAIVEAKVGEITETTSHVPKDSLKDLILSGDSMIVYSDDTHGEDSTVIYGIRTKELRNLDESFILVNGKEVPKDTLDALLGTDVGSEKIKAVTLLEKRAAVSVYGDKGKHGILNIQLLPDENNHFKITKTQAKIRTKATGLKTIGIPGAGGLVIRGVNDGQEPLFVVDGKEVVGPDPLSQISPDRIKGFSVLKAESALAVYGDKGKNGVIMIDLFTEEEYQARKDHPEESRLSAWKLAMNMKDNQPISTKKVAFYVNDKEVSEEELKGIPASEIGGVSRYENKEKDETVIHLSKQENADEWTIASGTVIDKNGKPVEGASVLIVGEPTGTLTDAKGYFELRTPKNASLHVAFGSNGVAGMKAAKNMKIVLDK